MDVGHIFTVLETNIYSKNVYVLYKQYIYTLQECMSTSGKVTHYIGWGHQSSNPQEIHHFK
jgi:hypothetical protein